MRDTRSEMDTDERYKSEMDTDERYKIRDGY